MVEPVIFIFIKDGCPMSVFARNVFTAECLNTIFPPERTDAFFDALFGDAEEGAYDIRLTFDEKNSTEEELHFYFELHQRPGHCLVCSLTYGLPQVFDRHPVLDLKGVVAELAKARQWDPETVWWRIGATESLSNALHRIPLVLARQGEKR